MCISSAFFVLQTNVQRPPNTTYNFKKVQKCFLEHMGRGSYSYYGPKILNLKICDSFYFQKKSVVNYLFLSLFSLKIKVYMVFQLCAENGSRISISSHFTRGVAHKLKSTTGSKFRQLIPGIECHTSTPNYRNMFSYIFIWISNSKQDTILCKLYVLFNLIQYVICQKVANSRW